MDAYTTLYGMFETALKQAGEESGMLLGQELSVTLSDSLSTSRSSYFGCLDDAIFALGVESGEDYRGTFYLLFSLRDAVVLSGILLGIPPARIQEKKRLSIIENDDIDAFSEIANMINGALNTVFQGSLEKKVRLKLLPAKKYIPEVNQLTADDPLPDGDYIMFRSKLEMPGQEMNHLDVLLPYPLAEMYDPQPVPEPEPEEETDDSDLSDDAGEGIAPRSDSGVSSVVVLDDDEEQRQLMGELLAFTGFQLVSGTLNADIKEMFANRSVKLVIIGSQDADDRELAVCIKVNAMRQDSPPPIIMSAECWTRTAVLKALKYGARDIIIKPVNSDDVTAKVRRYCKLPPV